MKSWTIRLVIIALGLFGGFTETEATDRTAHWTSSSEIWENPDNWDVEVYPDNDITGDSWTCIIDAGTSDKRLGVTQSHTVSYIETYSAPSGEVSLERWTWDWPELTFIRLDNYGNLSLEDLDISGDVFNYGVLEADDCDIDNGNLWNQSGGELYVDELDVDEGYFVNDGITFIFPNGGFWVTGSLTNNQQMVLYLSECSSTGLFTNSSGASIEGSGLIHSSTAIDNSGSIRSASADLIVHSGPGPIPATGSVTNTGSLSNSPGTSLHVYAGQINQQGTIVANSQGAVTFTCDLTNKSGASIELLGGTVSAPNITQKAGATFSGFGGLTGNLTNEGTIDLYGDSQIVGDVQNDSSAWLGIRNGDLLITGHTVNDGTIKALNGNAYFEGGLTNNGVLDIDPALAVVVGDLVVGINGVLVADAGSTLQLLGDLENRSIHETDFDMDEATVQFHGSGTPGNPQFLELAGEDFGYSLLGYEDNFAFGILAIEIGTAVQLQDLFDNDNRGGPGGLDEALYVDDLTLGAGTYLDLNGYNLYCLDGMIDPTASVVYNGGHLLELGLLPGDVDGDGWVGESDLSTIITYWGQSFILGRQYGDLNGNGIVDGPDYTEVLSYWNPPSEPPSGTPEPATLGLLVFGGAVLLRRRKF